MIHFTYQAHWLIKEHITENVDYASIFLLSVNRVSPISSSQFTTFLIFCFIGSKSNCLILTKYCPFHISKKHFTTAKLESVFEWGHNKRNSFYSCLHLGYNLSNFQRAWIYFKLKLQTFTRNTGSSTVFLWYMRQQRTLNLLGKLRLSISGSKFVVYCRILPQQSWTLKLAVKLYQTHCTIQHFFQRIQNLQLHSSELLWSHVHTFTFSCSKNWRFRSIDRF